MCNEVWISFIFLLLGETHKQWGAKITHGFYSGSARIILLLPSVSLRYYTELLLLPCQKVTEQFLTLSATTQFDFKLTKSVLIVLHRRDSLYSAIWCDQPGEDQFSLSQLSWRLILLLNLEYFRFQKSLALFFWPEFPDTGSISSSLNVRLNTQFILMDTHHLYYTACCHACELFSSLPSCRI